MSKHPLRDYAKGRQCTVMSNVCNKNPETVVLAHLNMRRVFRCGMGQKPPDWAGCYSCSDCHKLLDGPATKDYTKDELEHMHLVAMVRTLKILDDEEKLCQPTQ